MVKVSIHSRTLQTLIMLVGYHISQFWVPVCYLSNSLVLANLQNNSIKLTYDRYLDTVLDIYTERYTIPQRGHGST